jgi:hypothetical protein
MLGIWLTGFNKFYAESRGDEWLSIPTISPYKKCVRKQLSPKIVNKRKFIAKFSRRAIY